MHSGALLGLKARLRKRNAGFLMNGLPAEETRPSPLPATIFPTLGKWSLAVMEMLNYAPARQYCLWAGVWGQGPRHGAVDFSDLRRVGWLLSLAQGAVALGCGLLNLVVPGGVSQNTRIRRQRALVIVLPPASLKPGQCADRS